MVFGKCLFVGDDIFKLPGPSLVPVVPCGGLVFRTIIEVAEIGSLVMAAVSPEAEVAAETDTIFDGIPNLELGIEVGDYLVAPVLSRGV